MEDSYEHCTRCSMRLCCRPTCKCTMGFCRAVMAPTQRSARACGCGVCRGVCFEMQSVFPFRRREHNAAPTRMCRSESSEGAYEARILRVLRNRTLSIAGFLCPILFCTHTSTIRAAAAGTVIGPWEETRVRPLRAALHSPGHH